MDRERTREKERKGERSSIWKGRVDGSWSYLGRSGVACAYMLLIKFLKGWAEGRECDDHRNVDREQAPTVLFRNSGKFVYAMLKLITHSPVRIYNNSALVNLGLIYSGLAVMIALCRNEKKSGRTRKSDDQTGFKQIPNLTKQMENTNANCEMIPQMIRCEWPLQKSKYMYSFPVEWGILQTLCAQTLLVLRPAKAVTNVAQLLFSLKPVWSSD